MFGPGVGDLKGRANQIPAMNKHSFPFLQLPRLAALRVRLPLPSYTHCYYDDLQALICQSCQGLISSTGTTRDKIVDRLRDYIRRFHPYLHREAKIDFYQTCLVLFDTVYSASGVVSVSSACETKVTHPRNPHDRWICIPHGFSSLNVQASAHSST